MYNINNYYNRKLKIDRVKDIKKFSKKNKKKILLFYKFDLKEEKKLSKLFKRYKFEKVIHLAAQAGVRYSLIYPEKYLKNNIICFFYILECCRKYKIKKLIFASSSSVYGNLQKSQFSEKIKQIFQYSFMQLQKNRMK